MAVVRGGFRWNSVAIHEWDREMLRCLSGPCRNDMACNSYCGGSANAENPLRATIIGCVIGTLPGIIFIFKKISNMILYSSFRDMKFFSDFSVEKTICYFSYYFMLTAGKRINLICIRIIREIAIVNSFC